MATAISSINWQTDIKDQISVAPSTPTDKFAYFISESNINYTQVYHDIVSTSGSTSTLDLTSLVNVFGEALNFTSLKLLVVHVDSDCQIEFPDIGLNITLSAGGCFQFYEPNGVTITTGTLSITEIGTAPEANAQVILAD